MDEHNRHRRLLLLSMGVLMLAIGAASLFLQYDKPLPSKTIAREEASLFKAEEPQETEKGVRLLFVGDMMFDRYIRQTTEKRGGDFIFSCIDSLLGEADVVIGNLEGPITAQPSVSVGSVVGSPENFLFTFPLGTADLLLQHNIKVVNIGNNHIGNFGRGGVAATKRYLEDAGIAYFGDVGGESFVYRATVNRIDISFINYNQFGGESAEKVAERIREERLPGRKVIVYTHWGEEYVPPTDRVRSIARLFAESGADIIVGSHPHVVQSHERIGDTLVYYSLGNFIFDQYWDPAVANGLALLVQVSKDKIVVDEKPVVLTPDGRTCPV